jgi:hypothetical protein
MQKIEIEKTKVEQLLTGLYINSYLGLYGFDAADMFVNFIFREYDLSIQVLNNNQIVII